jgi:hypothetical protein
MCGKSHKQVFLIANGPWPWVPPDTGLGNSHGFLTSALDAKRTKKVASTHRTHTLLEGINYVYSFPDWLEPGTEKGAF